MKALYYLMRIFSMIRSKCRNYEFRHLIKCPDSDVKLVGDITVINRNIRFGRNVIIYPDVMFFGDGLIEIGDNVAIGNGTLIYASQKGGVHIGNDTMIAAQSYIIDTDHGIQRGALIREQENTVAPIHIGQDVWIAAGCKILKGSVIHDGAVIGAASLVKGEIPAYGIAVGAPAKVIKYRE